MPFPVLTAATVANCPHQMKMSFAASSSKVLVAGSPPMLAGDKAVVGPTCPFTVPTGKPQPCVSGKLELQTTKVKVEGRAVILRSPADLCESADHIPAGPVAYVNVQARVIAS